MFELDYYAQKSLHEVKQSADQLLKAGAVLSNNDKQLLLNAMRTWIQKNFYERTIMTQSGIKKEKWAFKDISIRLLNNIADKVEYMISFGLDVSADIDVSNLKNFKKALSDIDKYNCAAIGILSKSYRVSSIHDSRMDEFTTIGTLQAEVEKKRVPFLDEDVKKIMGRFSDMRLRTVMFDKGPTIRVETMSGAQHGVLDLNTIEEAARRGELRISLLNALGLLPSWDFQYRNQKSVEYKIGTDDLKDKIYALLQQSNRIEKVKILDRYNVLCNIPSFIRAINTGYYQQSSHEGPRQKSSEGSGNYGSSGQNSGHKTEKPKPEFSANNLLDMLKKRVSVPANPTLKEVTVAWKKYLRLVHPDLTTDPVEKARRTEETKILNNLHDQYMKDNTYSSAAHGSARKNAARE